MADSTRIVAGMAVIWGTDDVIPSTGTIVSDCTITAEGEDKEIPNNKGNTVEVVQFNDSETLSMTILMISTATAIKRGDKITVATKKYLVQKASAAYKRGEEVYQSIDCKSWENVSLGA